MTNSFCITYGGRASNGRFYTPYRAIVNTPEEAIAVINSWHSYSNKKLDSIVVNEHVEKSIRELFTNGFGTLPNGQPRTVVRFQTTGCCAWEISFYPALADNIDEHQRIYNERREAAKREREKRYQEALCKRRYGWYEVELEVCVFSDKRTTETWSGFFHAESAIDAYNQAARYIDKRLNEEGVIDYWILGPGSGGFQYDYYGKEKPVYQMMDLFFST
jgi:hypothetical protein